jgi:hypothetical protein
MPNNYKYGAWKPGDASGFAQPRMPEMPINPSFYKAYPGQETHHALSGFLPVIWRKSAVSPE